MSSQLPVLDVHTVIQDYYSRQPRDDRGCWFYEASRFSRILMNERTPEMRRAELKKLFKRVDAEQLFQAELVEVLEQGFLGVSRIEIRRAVEGLELDGAINIFKPTIKGPKVVAVLNKVQSNKSEPLDKDYILASEYLVKEQFDRKTLAWIRNGFEEVTYDYKKKKNRPLRELDRELFIGTDGRGETYDQLAQNQVILDEVMERKRLTGEKFERLKKMIVLALGKIVEDTILTSIKEKQAQAAKKEEEEKEKEKEEPIVEFNIREEDCQEHINRAVKMAQLKAWNSRIEHYEAQQEVNSRYV